MTKKSRKIVIEGPMDSDGIVLAEMLSKTFPNIPVHFAEKLKPEIKTRPGNKVKVMDRQINFLFKDEIEKTEMSAKNAPESLRPVYRVYAKKLIKLRSDVKSMMKMLLIYKPKENV